MKFHSNIILVLGQALDNGKLPLSLIGRMDHAISLFQILCINTNYMSIFKNDRDDIPLLILSGGDTTKVGISEAQAMKDFMNLKINSAAETFLEEKAQNTVENAIYCASILQQKDCRTVHIVTNEFHVPRSRCIFECVFKNNKCGDLELIFHKADSGMDIDAYRQLNDRPLTVSKWRLCERLDFEENALNSLNSYLAKYSFGPIERSRIERALQELREMNKTRGTNSE